MDPQPEKIKKRRVRKKTCEIDSYDKINVISRNDNTLIGVSSEIENDILNKEDVNHTQISFGKFNITVKKTAAMSPEELRKFYDDKFKINDYEKSAKLLIQDDTAAGMVYEPIMEDEITKVNKKDYINEPKIISKKTEKIQKTLYKFTNSIKSEWPESTDILCWWCAHNFSTPQIPCPVKYDEYKKHYKVCGVFCSWSCAAAHSVKEYSSITLLYQMKNEIGLCDCKNNCNCNDISIAPSRYILKNFGGYMSINDYRSLGPNKKILVGSESLSYINQDIAEISLNS
jgi:hypothetical protein